jgi:hypothetical protein
MCAQSKTKYHQYTLYLDPEIEEDKIVIDWLEKRHAKRNSYSTQIRKALNRIIEEETGKTCPSPE